MFEYIVLTNKYSRRFIKIYLEKFVKVRFFKIYYLNYFFCKMVYTLNLLLENTNSETFDKIYFAPPTLWIKVECFTLLISTIADKKKVKYFFESYIYAKFHQNRWFTLRQVKDERNNIKVIFLVTVLILKNRIWQYKLKEIANKVLLELWILFILPNYEASLSFDNSCI